LFIEFVDAETVGGTAATKKDLHRRVEDHKVDQNDDDPGFLEFPNMTKIP